MGDEGRTPMGSEPSTGELMGRVTAEEINSLPEHLRRYVRDLETICDPAGMVQEIAGLKMQVAELAARYERGKAEGVREERIQRLEATAGLARYWRNAAARWLVLAIQTGQASATIGEAEDDRKAANMHRQAAEEELAAIRARGGDGNGGA